MKTILGAGLLVLALAACGGGGSSSSSATETTPPAKVFAESVTCRHSLPRLLDIADLNSANGLRFETFNGRMDEMNRIVDRVVTACSNKVELPVRKGLYQYALANATWTACSFGSLCDTPQITHHILVAQSAFKRARTLLGRSR